MIKKDNTLTLGVLAIVGIAAVGVVFTLGAITTGMAAGGLMCGDGVVHPELGEECDDGNVINGDGCSALCLLEAVPPGTPIYDTIDIIESGEYYLANDITNDCIYEEDPEDGGYWWCNEPIDIWADDVVLDCNGHSINLDPEVPAGTYINITAIGLGADRVTVKNCVINDGFYSGISSGCGGRDSHTITGNTIIGDFFRSGIDVCAPNSVTSDNTVCVTNPEMADIVYNPGGIPGTFSGNTCNTGWPDWATVCDSTCPGGPMCGDGVVTGDEVCDDGNQTNGDGCDDDVASGGNCTPTECGNGVVTGGEECDDGNTTSGDGCDEICRSEFCGNSIIGFSDPDGDGIFNEEECDDGNQTNGDGCDATCIGEYCGDGIKQAGIGEQCDDGNTDPGDGCDWNCIIEYCGNGWIQIYEECDDGNDKNGDGCDNNCTMTACGNGVLAYDEFGISEQCDDGNTTSGDGCDEICRSEFCGNSIIGFSDPDGDGIFNLEECDDGNTDDGDGCDSNCFIEIEEPFVDFETFGPNDQGKRFGVHLDDEFEGLDWAYDTDSKINTWGSFTVQDSGAPEGNDSDGDSIPGSGGSENWLKARAGALGKGAKITRCPGECFEFKSMKLFTQDHPAFIDEVTVTWRTCDASTTVPADVMLTEDMWVEVTAADLGIPEGITLRAMWFNGAPINPNAAKFGLDDFEVIVVPEP